MLSLWKSFTVRTIRMYSSHWKNNFNEVDFKNFLNVFLTLIAIRGWKILIEGHTLQTMCFRFSNGECSKEMW